LNCHKIFPSDFKLKTDNIK